MNIVRENKDELNLVIKLQVNKADYEEKYNKELANYRRKANIPGFRPGNAPLGLVKKMVGKSILADEINKIISDGLFDYIKKENLKIIGEPLPSLTEQKPIDWDNPDGFEFAFDAALLPEIELKLTKKDKCPYYTIKVEENLIDNTVESHTRRYGKTETVEQAGENDLVRGKIEPIDENGNVVFEGFTNPNALISLEYIKDKNFKETMLQSKADDVIDFDVEKAFDPQEAKYIFGLKSNAEAQITGNYRLTINSISHFMPAEVNQELFDQVYGAEVVKSVEEYRAKIAAEIAGTFAKDSDYKFMIDIKKKIIEKLDIQLPDEFLKRWLVVTNEKITDEQIQNEYPMFREDLIWQMIKDKISKENNLEASEEDIMEFARMSTRAQFANYGLYNLPEENLNQFAQEIVNKPEEKNKIVSKILEDKVTSHLKSVVKLDEKEVTTEEFNKLFTA